MRWGWLDLEMHRVPAWALASFVGYMILVLPLYRRWRWPRLSERELSRLDRLARWRAAGHLTLAACSS